MGMLMSVNNIIMCPQNAEQKVDIYFQVEYIYIKWSYPDCKDEAGEG